VSLVRSSGAQRAEGLNLAPGATEGSSVSSALGHPCLSKRSWLRASAWAGLLLLAAALTSGSARADAYTWTDANGVVHFSETPPPEAKSQKLKPSDVSRPSALDPQRKIEKIWVSDAPSRSLALEKVVPPLPDADKGFTVGPRCDGEMYSVADAMRWSQSPDLKGYFNVSLMAYGFETASEAAARALANETLKPADLNVIAEVIAVSASCAGVEKLEINWRFWDNLRRKQVFEIVTRGADQGTIDVSERRRRGGLDADMVRSFSGAFIDSLETLLRRPYVIPIPSALATLAIRPALARKGDR
jgi:hypothetical protein